MFKSLYGKTVIVLLVIFSLIGLGFVYLTVFSTDMYQQEVNQKLNLKLAENIVSEKLLMSENKINQPALKEVFHMLMVINPSIELYLLDPQGKILAFSAPPGKVKLKKVSITPIQTWLRHDFAPPLLGDDPRNPGLKKAFTVARIPKHGPLEGYLYIILGGESYDGVIGKIKSSYIFRLSVWVIAGSLTMACIFGLIIFALLTRRLKRLAGIVDQFKKDMNVKQPIDLMLKEDRWSIDEVDRLSSAFLKMVKQIENQMDEIEHMDSLRRELVANVSHDLRTPIATLKGYIETMLLKEENISIEERKQYLKTAYNHCERLSALVAELFELAKLDSKEIKVVRELFNLMDLTQDVIQKFELEAKKKSIKIDMIFEKDLPLVEADIGLIERVLENLIENAIHYTLPNSDIKISMAREKQDVRVKVADTGPGIAPEDIDFVFDRFYKSDKSRQAKIDHSGLGLAITKKILELHDKTIQVESVLGQGTAFMFYLPIANS